MPIVQETGLPVRLDKYRAVVGCSSSPSFRQQIDQRRLLQEVNICRSRQLRALRLLLSDVRAVPVSRIVSVESNIATLPRIRDIGKLAVDNKNGMQLILSQFG